MNTVKDKKVVTIFFDFEANLSMQDENVYQIKDTTVRILKTLEKYDVKAVFFIVGELVESYPEVVALISEYGHEIGVHGYSHNNISGMSEVDLHILSAQLDRTSNAIKNITGTRPTSFRSPYLMAPTFFSKGLYEMLAKLGFVWVSNREIRYVEEIFRPDKIMSQLPFKFIRNRKSLESGVIHDIVITLINMNLFFGDQLAIGYGKTSILEKVRWLTRSRKPFVRNGLTEVALYSPMDCDLIGTPNPSEDTEPYLIEFAISCFVRGLERAGNNYGLNFHDWIIGSGNRIDILDETLRQIVSRDEITFSTSPLLRGLE